MKDVDPGELVSRLVVVSSRLTRALRRIIGNDSDLVVLRALGVVEQYQPVRVGHFAQGYLCSQPAATKLLARLEGEGLVERSASETDRRASQFSLTEAGRVRLTSQRSVMAEQMEPYFRSLSAEERVSVDRALGLVSLYLADQHPVDQPPGDDGRPMTGDPPAASVQPGTTGGSTSPTPDRKGALSQ